VEITEYCIKMRKPDDMHFHGRQGRFMRTILPFSEPWCARAIFMPNLRGLFPHGVISAEHIRLYRESIQATTSIVPLMTLKLHDKTTPQTIREARAAGAVGAKFYPVDITNAQSGVTSVRNLLPVLEEMSQVRMLFLGHCEKSGADPFSAEEAFLDEFAWVVEHVPELRVVFEHISSQRAVNLVLQLPERVAATITPHHCVLTFRDWAGAELYTPHYCRPVAKLEEDRIAVLAAAVSGNPKFFLGTDSAAHPPSKKNGYCASPGVFNAPVAVPLFADIFEREGMLDRLEAFTSEYGARFYDLPLNTDTITLIKRPWKVPSSYAGLVPLCAGRELTWRLESSS
jgi:dihydroorotase